MKPKKEDIAVSSFSYPISKSDILKEFKIIAAREGKSVSELNITIIEEYVKNHSEGNNTFKLDNWNLNPNFIVVPTLLSTNEKWVEFLKTCNSKEFTDIAIKINYLYNYIRQIQVNEFKNKKY